MEESEVCDIDAPYYSTITSRYYKGIGGHKDNMVIEVCKIEKEKVMEIVNNADVRLNL